MYMQKHNVCATIDSALLKELDELVQETERKRSWLINKAIEFYLEEIHDSRIAKSRLKDERISPKTLRKAIGV